MSVDAFQWEVKGGIRSHTSSRGYRTKGSGSLQTPSESRNEGCELGRRREHDQ